MAPIIARVIADVGRADHKALRRALRDAYPAGERKYWPYKVWCNEVRRQLGVANASITPRERLAMDDLFETRNTTKERKWKSQR